MFQTQLIKVGQQLHALKNKLPFNQINIFNRKIKYKLTTLLMLFSIDVTAIVVVNQGHAKV